MASKIGRKARRVYMPVEEMHLAGVPVSMIASLLGYKEPWLYQILRKLGYHQPRGRKPGAGKGLRLKRGWCIEEMYLTGLSLDDITALLGRSRKGIRLELGSLGYRPAIDQGYRIGEGWRGILHSEATQRLRERRMRQRAHFATGHGKDFAERYYTKISRIE